MGMVDDGRLERMTRVTIEERESGVRVLRLNDPDRRNVIDPEMRAQLLAAVARVADDQAKALVVTGAGSAFCAGADLPAIFGDRDRTVAQIRDDLQDVYESFLALRALRIPTIAAVQGPAVGAGLNLAMVCDLRVAGPDAKFAATFSQIGLHPGGGCTWFLVQALGKDRALQMLLDGGTVRGPDAVASGIATTYAEDPLAEALTMGERYASLDAQLARDIKVAVETAAAGDFQATLQFESWAQASAATKPEIHAFLERFRK